MADEILNVSTTSPILRGSTVPQLEELKERLTLLEHIDQVDNNLESCCFKSRTDKRLVILISQILVSFFVILFIFYKLSSGDTTANEIYMPMLSSIISYWFGRGASDTNKN